MEVLHHTFFAGTDAEVAVYAKRGGFETLNIYQPNGKISHITIERKNATVNGFPIDAKQRMDFLSGKKERFQEWKREIEAHQMFQSIIINSDRKTSLKANKENLDSFRMRWPLLKTPTAVVEAFESLYYPVCDQLKDGLLLEQRFEAFLKWPTMELEKDDILSMMIHLASGTMADVHSEPYDSDRYKKEIDTLPAFYDVLTETALVRSMIGSKQEPFLLESPSSRVSFTPSRNQHLFSAGLPKGQKKHGINDDGTTFDFQVVGRYSDDRFETISIEQYIKQAEEFCNSAINLFFRKDPDPVSA